MTIKVVRSRDYLDDLLMAWEYHSEWSESSADRIIGEIEAQVALLGEFPDLGERESRFGSDCRRTLADRYVIYYLRLEDHIRVLRVFHGAQQIDRLS